jgi:eukaryotic-like serine/threonine-protein kinase
MPPAADRLVADRYALKAPLGRGGMGVVWRAQDSVLGREVAVKEVVFPPTMAEEERGPAQARVMREARAAARLNHPGAVTLYDVVKDRGSTFIVMELVSAPTLADLVRTDGPLPVQRVAEIGAQVASALEAAHQAGIVHRDVKPGNVMVPAAGTAKLADFGIASLQGDPQLTSTGLVIGSPAYMAPEQAKGEESGPPADFWALGATMFYAVEGGPPFDRGSSVATLAAVVNEPPRDLRRAGPLTPLITALLSKDPGARPSGPELRAELARLATPAPSPPTEVLPTHGPGRTVPLPAFVPADAGEGDGTEADQGDGTEVGEGDGSGAVDSPEHPASGSATLPHRGPSQREGGFPAAQREGVPAAGAPVPELASALEPEPPAAEPPAAEAAGREPGRPLLPPAPVVGRGGRGRLVAVLGLLAVAGLVLVLVAANLLSGDDGDPAAAPGTTAGGAATTRGSETTGEAASTTGAPSTTAAPTTTAAAGLPEGWTAFTNRQGNNRVGVPPGFRARVRDSFNATVVEERDDPKRVFTVRSTNPANPLPQASRDYRKAAPGLFEDFREVSYEENQTYAGRDGAVVFEYEAVRDGRRVHVSHINLKGRSWGYNVEFIVPAEQWDASQDLARQFEQAFQPLG